MNDLRSTTILCVKKGGHVVMASDGQVTLGDMVCKPNANKVRKLSKGTVLVGFAGAVADCLTLVGRLEGKLEQYPKDLIRSVIELSKDWRADKYLKSLQASLVVADKSVIMFLGGNGEAMEVDDDVASVGSGSKFAISAAKALMEIESFSAEDVVRKSMKIASDLCVYTNNNLVVETL